MNLKQHFDTVIGLSRTFAACLTPTGTIIQANDSLTRLVGHSETSITGQHWERLFFRGKNRSEALAALTDCQRTKETTQLDAPLSATDGRLLHIEWKLKAILAPDGTPQGVVCVGQDASQHFALEKKLLHERAGLIERNKELTCLYGISQLVSDMDRDLGDLLHDIVLLIPDAFQFPEHTSARIRVDDIVRDHGNVPGSGHRVSVPINVNGEPRGKITIAYHGEALVLDCDAEEKAGIFLNEEKSLVDAISKQVGLVVAKKEALSTRQALERQLRHADRLAKIGQFAAGVAHELNEPLATILGFAQLAEKNPNLPVQLGKDLDNIIKASLHAREVIRKLMFFSRQVPPQTIRTNLNEVINETLYFTEPSANRNNVELEIKLADNLPYIMADPQHMKQVIVNLAANAIHAMQDGGTLTFETHSFKDDVYLIVSDTGQGMPPDVLKQIFTPFFTTKDINEGTGLGLAVVHGIVKAHGGVVDAMSTPGRGTRFEIAFPCAASRLRAQ